MIHGQTQDMLHWLQGNARYPIVVVCRNLSCYYIPFDSGVPVAVILSTFIPTLRNLVEGEFLEKEYFL